MKKLKLESLGLSASELLNREQMKKVFAGCGGGSGGGSGAAPCKDGSCTITTKDVNGNWVTLGGNCRTHYAAPTGNVIVDAWNVLHPDCYCDALAYGTPLSSNGGVSRCTN